MAIRHIPDGGDFHFDREFGFHGSSGAPDPMQDRPVPGDRSSAGMRHADGGPAMGGGNQHPHGGEIVHVEHFAGGGKVCHYAHGGYSIHHPGGHVSHHGDGGEPMTGGKSSYSQGGIERMHDSSEYAHRKGGAHRHDDAAQDKAMIEKAFKQHEAAEHEGGDSGVHLARGGRPSLPRGMKVPGMRKHSGIGEVGAPSLKPSPRNVFPAGQMGYGVQPSDEPDQAGSGQMPPAMRKGGRYGG